MSYVPLFATWLEQCRSLCFLAAKELARESWSTPCPFPSVFCHLFLSVFLFSWLQVCSYMLFSRCDTLHATCARKKESKDRGSDRARERGGETENYCEPRGDSDQDERATFPSLVISSFQFLSLPLFLLFVSPHLFLFLFLSVPTFVDEQNCCVEHMARLCFFLISLSLPFFLPSSPLSFPPWHALCLSVSLTLRPSGSLSLCLCYCLSHPLPQLPHVAFVCGCEREGRGCRLRFGKDGRRCVS